MGLIKNHYQKIISYGLIAIGLLSAFFVFILKPQRAATQELYNYGSDSTLTKISFPYSKQIPITVSNIDYIEIVFGDDSINQHEYSISASKENETLFEHAYINEQSNAVRIPLSSSNLQPSDNITIQITCRSSCNDVYFTTYNTKDGAFPKAFLVSSRNDYRYLWYSAFLVAIGLTLIPLIKEKKK